MTRPILIGLTLAFSTSLFAIPEFTNGEMLLPSVVAGQPFEYDLTKTLKPTSETVEFTLIYPPDFPSWLSLNKQGVLYGTPALEDKGNYVFEVMATHPGDRDIARLSAMITVTDPAAGITPLDRARP